MIVIKCLFFLFTIHNIYAASVEKRYIPVRVVYDKTARNLEEKVQLSPDELVENQARLEANAGQPPKGNPNAVKNLDAKTQLSPEQLRESLKHLPVQDDVVLLKSSTRTLAQQAEDIVLDGLDNLKQRINSLNGDKPTDEDWAKLNVRIKKFIEAQQSDQTRQDSQNNQFLQNIISGVQNFTGNFLQNFQSQRPVNGTEDEQRPGFGQTVANYFSQGIQQIVSNINNLNPQSTSPGTVLDDTGSTERPGNIFSGVISSVQQIFTGPNPGNKNQSDTGVQPVGFFQGTISQVQQAISNFIPTSSTPAPGSQGDETTSPAPNGPVQVIQSIGNQIGSAISQVNPFASTAKPPEDEGAAGPANPPNIIQSIGQTIQNLNPFRPQNGSNPIASGIESAQNQAQQVVDQINGTNNPIISGIQSAGNQLQELVTGASITNLPVLSSSTEVTDAKKDEIMQTSD